MGLTLCFLHFLGFPLRDGGERRPPRRPHQNIPQARRYKPPGTRGALRTLRCKLLPNPTATAAVVRRRRRGRDEEVFQGAAFEKILLLSSRNGALLRPPEEQALSRRRRSRASQECPQGFPAPDAAEAGGGRRASRWASVGWSALKRQRLQLMQSSHHPPVVMEAVERREEEEEEEEEEEIPPLFGSLRSFSFALILR
ncbi:hypothetical protein AXF42_Ash009364 [Apostasia shenzhenica]|uniref:Uncharacterized protein n=1 Tax=Apostasia shenzhenica TaxID=1088818 RepID=A0A2I0B3W2_9ASPA|nr:hypothetical protein AXF42_Ash009364 [Apostasia shenzhenica]